MGFDVEPMGYEKTILSDLQGAWQCLRQEVAESPGFDGWEQALFHIDQALRTSADRKVTTPAGFAKGFSRASRRLQRAPTWRMSPRWL